MARVKRERGPPQCCLPVHSGLRTPSSEIGHCEAFNLEKNLQFLSPKQSNPHFKTTGNIQGPCSFLAKKRRTPPSLTLGEGGDFVEVK